MYCRRCHYDLRAVAEPRCPECGRPFDPADPGSFTARPPMSWRPFLWAGAVVAGTFLVTWGVFFVQTRCDTRVDVDLGVAPATLHVVDQIGWAALGAVCPTAAAVVVSGGLVVWHFGRRRAGRD